MSHAWNPPTYADVVGVKTVKCPQCHRPVSSDMLHSTADYSPALMARFRRNTVDYLCDSCRSTLFREERLSVADHVRLLGAPESHATMIEAKQGERGARGRNALAVSARDTRRGSRGV